MRPVGRRWCAALVLVAAAAPLLVACGSDASGTHTIAVLRAVPIQPERQTALLAALARAGYEGESLEVLGADEAHAAPADAERAVRRWVKAGAELVVALSTTSAQAARAATTTVPIVVLSNDLRASGLVGDERHPDANVTGTNYRVPSDRLLALASDAFASAAFGELDRIGCLYPDGDPGAAPVRSDLERGARALGMDLTCAPFQASDAVAGAVQRLVAARAQVVYLVNAPASVQAAAAIEAATDAAHLPVLATNPTDYATILLEPDGKDVYAQLGRQAGRLLGGADVADVPVQDPGRYMLVVNAKRAAALGLRIAPAVLRRADQVIR
jgi:putative ABC transport system substrate-binding protein